MGDLAKHPLIEGNEYMYADGVLNQYNGKPRVLTDEPGKVAGDESRIGQRFHVDTHRRVINLKVSSELGDGLYGTVYLMCEWSTPRQCTEAIKLHVKMELGTFQRVVASQVFANQILPGNSLRLEVAVWQGPALAVLVMPRADGDLATIAGSIPYHEIMYILEVMRKNRMMHGDFKLNNLLSYKGRVVVNDFDRTVLFGPSGAPVGIFNHKPVVVTCQYNDVVVNAAYPSTWSKAEYWDEAMFMYIQLYRSHKPEQLLQEVYGSNILRKQKVLACIAQHIVNNHMFMCWQTNKYGMVTLIPKNFDRVVKLVTASRTATKNRRST